MDASLIDEFDETVKLVKQARKELKKEPVIEGQRGGARVSPWAYILRDQQAHLSRLARIATTRKLTVPVVGDELAELLD